MLAPIALFTYNRLEHTKDTVASLQDNELAKQSDLIIFSDGAKTDKQSNDVDKVRLFLETIQGFKSVKIIKRNHNLGLSKSIVSGVNNVLETNTKIIVLEDDMVTSPYFLTFMNEGLIRYEQQEEVASIHGYVFPVKQNLPETFFLKGSHCWGWATWQRGWQYFNEDAVYLYQELHKQHLTREFDFDNTYPFTKLLKAQIEGKVNSWDICWYAATFLQNKLCLHPGRSLVHNIGNDGSGIHCGPNHDYDVTTSTSKIVINDIEIVPSIIAVNVFKLYFRHLQKNNTLLFRITKKLSDFLKMSSNSS